jgi:tetratricopeptide (TPR) repeat protein
MDQSWNDRIASFWATADDSDPDLTMDAMRLLVEERPPADSAALYEWASVHDFLGREREAITLYRAALDAGLSAERESRAVIQLASSLRNVGEARAAADLLEGRADDVATGAAAQAFLALALHDAGEPGAALRVALKALAPTLPLYGRAVASYAEDLTTEPNSADGRP